MSKNFENRSTPRENCLATVLLGNIPGQLRDINETGLKVAFFSPLSLELEERITINIYPDELWNIPTLEIKAQLRWKKKDEIGVVMGFSLREKEDSPQWKGLKELIEFYKL